ncbi:MAG TPA: hypothetical protein VNT32_05930 [Thermoleophilaceae bacterium]|nr:hypothetical protein [Thermoleophilaceae bacterium]
MPRNDPTDTGGLFVGRRPGTAPLRYRAQPVTAGPARQRFDRGLGALILTLEVLLCGSLWGPQPVAWLWVGSQLDYLTDSVVLGIVSAFAGMLVTLFFTLAVLKRLDLWWRLVRRAGGYEQREGVLERIFLVTAVVFGSAFTVWFFVIEGPGSSVFSNAA